MAIGFVVQISALGVPVQETGSFGITPTIVCGNEAIAFMRAEAGPPNARAVYEPIIDNFVFDDDGKIVRVRAFYDY